jgi:hypothetical protein
MAKLKLYRVELEDGGEPMRLRLTGEQASAFRKDARVAKVTAAKASDEKAASPSSRAEEVSKS